MYLRHETNVWFEITTLLIPGVNDDDAELEELSQWIVEQLGPKVPLHFTAFHPDFRMFDRPPTPPATLRRARSRWQPASATAMSATCTMSRPRARIATSVAGYLSAATGTR